MSTRRAPRRGAGATATESRGGRRPLRSLLLAWFDANRRDLPWRRTRDPYSIWLSEVMLQQTQVQTVIPYWRRFLERFPTVPALAASDLDAVFSLWRGLGYYSRARNLHAAARAIVDEHGGQLPRSVEALRELPGFGRYTAGAVASIAFGVEAPLVDGNVARVLSRVFELDAPEAKSREKEQWRRADELVVGERPGDFNQAMMELGALVCTPQKPRCGTCPIRTHCGALRSGRVDQLPPRKVRSVRRALQLNVAVVRRAGRVLLARRAGRGLFGGLWELPSAEGRPEALCALIGDGRMVRPLGSVRRVLTHRDLELKLFALETRKVARALDGYSRIRWVTAAEAATLGMSTAMKKALDQALAAS